MSNPITDTTTEVDNKSHLQWDHDATGTRFQGRNGYFKQKGLFLNTYIWQGSRRLAFVPETSKSNGGNCEVQIPIDKIPELIAKLQTIYIENECPVFNEEGDEL